MSYSNLRSAKFMAMGCAVLLITLTYFSGGQAPQVSDLEGVVDSVAERDGTVLGIGVRSDDQVIAVNAPVQAQPLLTNAGLVEGQQVKLKVSDVRGTKRGVVCNLVSVEWAGPAPEQGASTPKRDTPLPIDDLKPGLGVKGM